MAIIWKSLVSLLQHILHTPNITSYINFPELNIYLSLSGLSHYLSNLSLACQFLLNFPSHQKILILFVLFLLHSLFNSLLSYLLNFLLITFFFYNSSCVFSIFFFIHSHPLCCLSASQTTTPLCQHFHPIHPFHYTSILLFPSISFIPSFLQLLYSTKLIIRQLTLSFQRFLKDWKQSTINKSICP